MITAREAFGKRVKVAEALVIPSGSFFMRSVSGLPGTFNLGVRNIILGLQNGSACPSLSLLASLLRRAMQTPGADATE